jgi:hypothetical protein
MEGFDLLSFGRIHALVYVLHIIELLSCVVDEWEISNNMFVDGVCIVAEHHQKLGN